MPSGWRTSRRGSRAGKKARREVKRQVHIGRVTGGAKKVAKGARDIAYLIGVGLASIVGIVVLLFLIVLGVNEFARWNALRAADEADSPAARAEKARENLLLIATDGDRATGFLALRYDADQDQVYGIAIPDGAFLEVPGQGFERIGDSYEVGVDVSLAAISNFFTVPFETYAIIDTEIYQTVLTAQSLAGVGESLSDTNLSDEQLESWTTVFDATPVERVAIVPMPVKPINLGNATYFEPQREELADLLESWWGVTITESEQVVRVIVYNGAGVPGIAGEAAQQLIRGGFRVVDTKNADNFDYAETQVVVQNGDESSGTDVIEVLGTGTVTVQPSDQQVADIIVIVGKDFKPGSGQ